MINEEVKVIECTVSTLEEHLNKMSEQSWDLVDWKVDFSSGKVIVILCRSFSMESLDWFDKLEEIVQKLEDLKRGEE